MASNLIRISSALRLETRAGALAGKRWMELLASIGQKHSISAAAKSVRLSYKAAWDAIETMNNLSERPLVERTKGGKGGGGTKLTVRGKQIVATFGAVEAENTRFVDLLNARIKNLDRDLRIIGRLAMLTSARNHFAGKVSRVQKGAQRRSRVDAVRRGTPDSNRHAREQNHEKLLGINPFSRASHSSRSRKSG